MSEETENPLEQMTRDEKVAAGYRPVRCSRCIGAGIEWKDRKKRAETCPQCRGEKFFWVRGRAPREPGE